MTIATTTNKTIGQGNGATTNWPFLFKIPDAASLVVIYTDANGVLTTLNSAQYSVAGLGASAGGSVTYPLAGAPIALGTTLTILRTVSYVQQSSVRNQSGFFPDVYEDALDYLTYQTQQLSEIVGRCAQITSTTSGVTMTMPAPLASAAIGWNSTGTGLANIVVAGTIAVPVGINQGGTGQQTRATGAAALGLVELINAAGTANAQTANAPANYTAFTATDLLEYIPPITNTGAVTITVTPAGGGALAARNVFYDGAACAGGELVLGVPTLLLDDGVRLHIVGYSRKVRGSQLSASSQFINGTLVPSQNGTVLTVAIKTLAGADPSAADPVGVVFRNVTSKTGDYSVMWLVAATSISTTVAGTFGVANGVPFRLWVAGFNDGGVFRLALINCLSTVAGAGAGRDVTAIFPLSQFGIASATQIGAGSVLSQTFYSFGAAVAAKAYATLGYLTYEAGLAAAGTFGIDQSRTDLFRAGVPLPGQVIQVQRNDTGAVATGTTVIPSDDTIPQSGEGDQYMTQAITPGSAANVIDINVGLIGSNNAATGDSCALFQDATANALKSAIQSEDAVTLIHQFSLNAKILAAGTVATTLKVRAGPNGAATFTFNGASGGRFHGGVLNSFTEAREVMG